jgi:5'-nucleotidase (lipoprotein e(P4) family)
VKRGFLLLATGLAGCATAPATPPAAIAAPAAAAVPPTMQWFYGSGEGAAASIQAYHGFRDYVLAAARARPRDSVVLVEGATLDAPRFLPCGERPLAVILDVDETALQNIGYEYDEAARGLSYDSARWNRYERTGAATVLPMPGAVTALRALREAGVAVIFNSNRVTEFAAQTAAAIEGAGLGPARHRETLWLKGDLGPGSEKDARRALVSERYCVVAMAGDQLGDFSDLFNVRTLAVADRRRAAAAGAFASLWGNGWFILSNPVYGPGLRGTFDDVFPADHRWSDPQQGNAQ